VKVGIPSPPPSQSAIQLRAYPAIALGCSLRVTAAMLPTIDHPQWSAAQACFLHRRLDDHSVIWRHVGYGNDPVGTRSGRTVMPADDSDRAVCRDGGAR
jgi:hypothetical protein